MIKLSDVVNDYAAYRNLKCSTNERKEIKDKLRAKLNITKTHGVDYIRGIIYKKIEMTD
jgi:hypothetical protein